MMRFLSLGAGVQSTTIALMAHHGDIPPLECAIFADTESEPAAVYRHLEWLIGVLRYPVHIVGKGSLRQEIFDAAAGRRGAWGRPPLYVRNRDGSEGLTRRQCTGDYKIRPILAKARELAGIRRGSPGPRQPVLAQILGISFDEAHRMRDGYFRWIVNEYPLVDRRMTRSGCVQWLEAHGYRVPPKSACTFCPYHSDRMWAEMQRDDPTSFADAVAVDAALREASRHHGMKGELYLHRKRIPLALVDFSHITDQPDLFGNECAGVCGV